MLVLVCVQVLLCQPRLCREQCLRNVFEAISDDLSMKLIFRNTRKCYLRKILRIRGKKEIRRTYSRDQIFYILGKSHEVCGITMKRNKRKKKLKTISLVRKMDSLLIDRINRIVIFVFVENNYLKAAYYVTGRYHYSFDLLHI